MGKVIDKGAVPPDDPMFLGGPTLFSTGAASEAPSKTSPSAAGKTSYPEQKSRELDATEKQAIRGRLDSGESDIYKLAQEFGCSSSQVAGIKAHLSK